MTTVFGALFTFAGLMMAGTALGQLGHGPPFFRSVIARRALGQESGERWPRVLRERTDTPWDPRHLRLVIGLAFAAVGAVALVAGFVRAVV